MESTLPVERTLTPLDHIRLTRIASWARQGMEELLASCDLVAAPAIPPDVVTMYSQVLLADTESGECSKLTLCYPADAEPEKGFISVLSPVGTSLRDYLALDDTFFTIKLTPNRADCLSVEGIAREVALLNRIPRPVRPMIPPLVTSRDEFPIVVSAPEACPRYLGRVIRNIHAGVMTPLWMRERLRCSGLRSLDPAVDVTNYVLLELGQPLHAFDLDRLTGSIQVRFARPGEKVELLNDQTVELTHEALIFG